MQTLPSFERLEEWEGIARALIELRPERYGHIDPEKIVAYVITNKERSDIERPYEMQTDKLPMRLTNEFDYFVYFKHPDDWHAKPKNVQENLVASALERIDPNRPFSIGPYDYKDQAVMVKTFGVDWANNPNVRSALDPNLAFATDFDSYRH